MLNESARNILLNGISVASRTAAGTLVFVINARVFGAESFGILMSWFAIGSFFAIPANYGLVPVVLRDCSANPGRAMDIMSNLLSLKVVLTAITLPFTVAFGLVVDHGLVFVLLAWTQIADTFIDFFMASLRTKGLFWYEAISYSTYSVASLAAISATAVATHSLVLVSLSFLLCRLSFAIVTLVRVELAFAKKLRRISTRQGLSELRGQWSYAVDVLMQATMTSVDTAILRIVAGPVAVGIYQAGTRVAYGLLTIVTVLTNVLIPRTSPRVHMPGAVVALVRIISVFAKAGLVAGMANYVIVAFLMPHVYGAAFAAVTGLAPALSLFVAARFAASGTGITLVLVRHTRARIASLLLGSTCLISFSFVLGSRYREVGVAWALVASTAIMGAAMLFFCARYLWARSRRERRDPTMTLDY